MKSLRLLTGRTRSLGSYVLIAGLASLVTPATAGLDEWTAAAPMTTPRWGSSVGVINNVMVVAGGYNGAHTMTVDAYDPVANEWSGKTSLPGVQTNAADGVINGILYLAGGTNNSVVISTVRAYDPVGDAWTTRASIPTGRQGAASGVIDGRLYVAGGSGAGSLATLEVYDPVADSWSGKAAMPTARDRSMGFVANGRFYVVGGSSTISATALATLECYDPGTNSWTTKTPMPTARNSAAVAVVDGTVYVVGGSDHAGATVYTTVEAYDPDLDQWTTVAPMASAAAAPNAASLNGFLYACGGYSVGAVAANAFYTIPVATDPAGGITATAAALNGSVKPVGSAATVRFEYGTTTAYGDVTAAQPVAGVSVLAMNAFVSGLTPSTTYHFRMVGTFDGVDIRGGDETFDTPVDPKVAVRAQLMAKIAKLKKRIRAAQTPRLKVSLKRKLKNLTLQLRAL